MSFLQIDRHGVWLQRRGRIRYYEHRRHSWGESRAYRVARVAGLMGLRRLRLRKPACDRYILPAYLTTRS